MPPIITNVLLQVKHLRDWGLYHNRTMTTVAYRLKELRASLDLTQAELAKRAHLKNQSIIGALESGARKKSSHIPAIAKALGVEALWLAEGKGPQKTGTTQSAQEVREPVAPYVKDPILDDLAVLEPEEAESYRLKIESLEAAIKSVRADIRAAAAKARRQQEDREMPQGTLDPPLDLRRTA